MTGGFGRNHDHIHIAGGLDLAEMNIEALAEWLGGYKSNKIADKSSEIKELQRIIDLCNKNKTCKAVLSDILKNAEKN